MELLVVMAIISILAGLLVPVLGAARATAKDTQCVGNLINIGRALLIYGSQYNDHIPAAGPGEDGNSQAWYYSLLPLVGGNWDIYECPSKGTTMRDIPEQDGNTASISGPEYHTVNYGMNFQFPGTNPSEDLMGNYVQMAIVVNATEVMIIADGALFLSGTKESDLDGDNELPVSIREGGLYFEDTAQADHPTVSPRHRAHTMCLFLDGHVTRVQTKQIFAADRGKPDCFYDAGLVDF